MSKHSFFFCFFIDFLQYETVVKFQILFCSAELHPGSEITLWCSRNRFSLAMLPWPWRAIWSLLKILARILAVFWKTPNKSYFCTLLSILSPKKHDVRGKTVDILVFHEPGTFSLYHCKQVFPLLSPSSAYVLTAFQFYPHKFQYNYTEKRMHWQIFSKRWKLQV